MGSGSSIEELPAIPTQGTELPRIAVSQPTDLEPEARGASLTRVKPASRSRDGSSNQVRNYTALHWRLQTMVCFLVFLLALKQGGDSLWADLHTIVCALPDSGSES